MKALLLCAALALMNTMSVAATSTYEIPFKDIDGKDTSLNDYKGKVLLVVNVASKCGLTPQYAGLEAMYQKYKGQGLVVLGFPCNQFGMQEPGSNEEIKEFCSTKYNVTFPMHDKVDVNGPSRHPLFTALAGESSPYPGDIKWNFNKFLIGKNGQIINRFEPSVKPDSPELVAAVEKALAAKK
jgi:glutathione peroxidase